MEVKAVTSNYIGYAESIEGVTITCTYLNGWNRVYVGRKYQSNSTEEQAIDTSTIGKITIPSECYFKRFNYNYPIYGIMSNAFKDCAEITEIVLPETIQEIKGNAFSGCSSLTSINIPKSVKQIEYYTFKGCSSLKSIIIPEGVTSIGGGAFKDCTSLTSITLPSTLKSIESGVFECCSMLSSITIPEAVTSIGSNAFKDCTSLTSITLPSALKIIESGVFEGCSMLSSITIPEEVASIGSNAFKDCMSLTSITLPINLNSIGDNAFADCTALYSINFPNNILTVGSKVFDGCSSLISITIPSSITTIGSQIFSNCPKLLSVTISQGLQSIGQAFVDCTSITALHIPESITELSDGAFKGCTNLESIALTEGLTVIGANTFENCSSLKSVEIPSSVSSIGANCFTGCSSLTNIVINDSEEPLTVGDANVLKQCQLETLYLGRNIKSFSEQWLLGVVSYFSSLKSVTLGHYVTSDINFYGCVNLESVIIQSSPLELYSFSGCSNLKSIEIPSSVYKIKDYGFYNCNSLENILVNGGLSEIGKASFEGCTSLICCEINCDSLSLGGKAFYGCTSLRQLVFNGEVLEIGEEAFSGCVSLDSIVIPDGITILSKNLFNGCNQLKSVELPSTVLDINTGAFAGCSNLQHINLPMNMNNISTASFSGCYALGPEISISCKNIEEQAFKSCTNLRKVNFLEGTETIGAYVFGQSTTVQDVVLPNSLKQIDKDAFYKYNLNEVVSLIQIPFAAQRRSFFGNINVVYVPYSKSEIYGNTYGWSSNKIVESEPCYGDYFDVNIQYADKVKPTTFKVVNNTPLQVQIGYNSVHATPDDVSDELIIPSSIVGPQDYTFSVVGVGENSFSTTDITSLKINSNIRYIESGAFSYCDKLETLSIDKSVSNIGAAFTGCSSLSSVYANWRNFSNVEIANENFDAISDDATLYVPAGTKSIYSSHDVFCKFPYIIEKSPISIGDITARYGGRATLPIYLSNDEEIAGVQFSLTLPEGVNVLENGDDLVVYTVDRTGGWTIMGCKDEDKLNTYNFVILSLDGKSLGSQAGAIMNIALQISSDMEVGVYDMILSDIFMTTANLDTGIPASSTSELTITDAILGDVNNDGTINVTDAIGVVNHILKQTPTSFIEGAADMNNDNTINVTDAIAIVNIILNRNSSSLAPVRSYYSRDPQ